MIEIDKKESEAARAAWLYYHEELTQSEIATELSVSRSTVTRLLQRAKLDGLVHISLNVSASMFKAERDLEQAFGLDRVRIVPAPSDEAMQKRWLGHAAAELLAPMMIDKAVVAVGWGSTLLAMTASLVGSTPLKGVQVVPFVGGLHNALMGTDTNEIAKVVGQHFNAAVRPLLAPIYVQDETTALALANDPGIRDALDLARRASVVVYSVGAMHNETTMFRLGHITAEQNDFLRKHGAVGDIACRWIDRDGRSVEMPASINPIGIALDELKRIPRRLAVAGGETKRDIVLAALRGGFVTTLVTDERTADYVLRHR
ncbi:sugar-binding transcriptional regulator [Lichenihabitans sp. Uapishka_5]|uniref:sugar-binding transcriptional regulator n=1 Tax=Lichenihabitans sp. Uapishka_5 TaxID=3037302 RepID=UPI0029E8154D|nr:sugar-binding transcriptional regulator [Lichenihabitans sp. Uapishka_5]MDX7950289.1 sugar-binding transcriptional regulator [Lichenihabitans sp. Uapishka_5]